MSTTKTTTRGTRLDRVTVPQNGVSIITSGGGSVTLRAFDDGVRAEPDLGVGAMLLRVDEPTELHDGDVLRAGTLWMSFHAGRGGRPGRLCLLDAKGGVKIGITLRGGAVSIGRGAGDVVMPWDDTLAELHLRVLMRYDGTFVQDLASASGTWVVVRRGEVLPSGSVISLEGRLLRVSTPPSRRRPVIDGDGPTTVFVAA